MRKFKHKQTDIIAYEDCSHAFYNLGSTSFPTKLIENTNDWEEIIEEEKLSVPIGTKFKVDEDSIVYTIEAINSENRVEITCTTPWKVKCQSSYSIRSANDYFKYKTWKIYKKSLFITEDSVEKFVGDDYYFITDDTITNHKVYENQLLVNGTKRFHSREKAQEYINNTKPVFSKQQIRDVLNKTWMFGVINKEKLFKELGL
jgi:hypothetical protein